MIICSCVDAIQHGAICKKVCGINAVVLFLVLSMFSAAYLAHIIFQKIEGIAGEILEQDFRHHEKDDRSLKVRIALFV